MAGRGSVVVVGASVAAVAAALVAAAGVSDERPSTTTTTARVTPTSPRRMAEFPSGEEWSIVTAVTMAPDLTTTTVDAPPAVAPPASIPVSPPIAGEYRYRHTEDGATDERRYRVEDVPPAEGEARLPGELRFRVTLERPDGSVTTELSWRPEAVVVLATTIRAGQIETACEWDPDWTQIPFPLSPGLTWSYRTACTTSMGGEPVRFDRNGEFTVEVDERIDVGGHSVASWRIAAKETVRLSGAIERTDQELRTFWFAPKFGVTIRESARQRQSSPDGVSESASERELISVSPFAQ